MSSQISDPRRKKLRDDLYAALLLLYLGSKREALSALGVHEDPTLTPDAETRLSAFADDRAQKIQDGINQRLAGTEGDEAQRKKEEIAAYTTTVLLAYTTSWAHHQGQSDAYDETPSGAGTAKQATLWVWTQLTDYLDDCTAAMDASPAAYDDLVGIAGGEPPVHPQCACDLSPSTT